MQKQKGLKIVLTFTIVFVFSVSFLPQSFGQSQYNLAPVADAGNDIVAFENETVTLDGSLSYDPDDPEGVLPIQYIWSLSPDGPSLCEDWSVPYCKVTVPSYTEEIVLTVSDGYLTDTDTVRIINLDEITGPAGVDGLTSLIDTDNAVGGNCDEYGNGGIRIKAGIDDNGNGVLEIGEIDVIQYLCNGADGPQGDPGITQDELSSLWQMVKDNRTLLEQLPMLKKELETLQIQVTQ